jgi:uncharacterized membrane protein required for colicin V production
MFFWPSIVIVPYRCPDYGVHIHGNGDVQMWVDILSGAIVLIFMFFGWRWGAWVQITRLLLAGVALFLAVGAASTTPGMFLKIFPWTYVHAQAWGFVVFFLLFFLMGRFVVERFILEIDEHREVPGALSATLGALLGALRGGLIVYGVLASFVLINRSHGAETPSAAVAFHLSYAGREVMVNNVVDPEPFPHNRLFRDLMGEDPERKLTDVEMDQLTRLADHPKAQFIRGERKMMEDAMAGNWEPLIQDRRIFELLTDAAFLQIAWTYEGGSFDEFIRTYEE